MNKSSMEKKQGKVQLGLLLGIFGSGLFIILIILIVLDNSRVISLQEIFYPTSSQIKQAAKLTNSNPTAIIAKAGEENIYQKDLDMEIASYPLQKGEDEKKILVGKLVKDSIILQASQDEGRIKLDERVFNSLSKDYVKRIKLVADARKKFEDGQDVISGSFISIWFYNMKPPVVGYEKGKEIALNKITALYTDVKSQKITIKQAAQQIIDDKSLAQVDSAYASNAISTFRAGPKDPITFDPAFDNIIRGLKRGQITDIYLAKNKMGRVSNKMIDAVYMFAQLDERYDNGRIMDFDEWYAQKEKGYEVIIY